MNTKMCSFHLTMVALTVWLFCFEVFASWSPEEPENYILNVCENAGINRHDEVVNSGIPLPKSLNIYEVEQLAIFNGEQEQINADFRVLSRWGSDRSDKNAPIKWVLVNFAAHVKVNECQLFELKTVDEDLNSTGLAQGISVTETESIYRIDTGAATFEISKFAGPLFHQIYTGSGTPLLDGAKTTATVDGNVAMPVKTRSVSLESVNDSRVVVKSDHTLSAPVKGEGRVSGTGLISTTNRYEFTLGSPTAVVRTTLNWEGNHCLPDSFYYAKTCPDGELNARLISLFRHQLNLRKAFRNTLKVRTNVQNTPIIFDVSNNETVKLEQKLRDSAQQETTFELTSGVIQQSGNHADAATFSLSGGNVGIAVSMDHMHRFEPQALSVDADGALNIDMASDKVWLGIYQGLYATFSVTALDEGQDHSQVEAQSWAKLNTPLRAWPSAAWFAYSGAVEEFPYAELNSDVSSYDEYMSRIMSITKQKIDEVGLSGLMTFGVYPRYWGRYGYHEIQCQGNDPTPEDSWDNKYWCGTWTDYHNTSSAVPVWVMRSGEVSLLHELSFPAALRVMHTQVFQCAPNDNFFRCGQAPSGYGAYRSDANSSHAYFDNLFTYYWLTGDETVIEKLARGAETMRRYLCPKRNAEPLGRPCDADDPTTSRITGRAVTQWKSVFRFLGESIERSYLDDWKSAVTRWVEQHYAHLDDGNGNTLGFTKAPSAYGISKGEEITSQQVWMLSMYDYNNLFHFMQLDNQPNLVNGQLMPSDVFVSWANTLGYFSSLYGDLSQPWPNKFSFTFDGEAIGGKLSEITTQCPMQNCLYQSNKAALAGNLYRAADLSMNSVHLALAQKATKDALYFGLHYELQPLNKITGFYTRQLHSAVARYSQQSFVVPSVNAGDDAEYSFHESLTVKLQGDVSGEYEYAQWSMLEGPSDVEFIDRRSLNTEVTFTQSGKYTLSLSASTTGGLFSDKVEINLIKLDNTNGLPAHTSGDIEYFLGAWYGDRSPKVGLIELLVHDVNRGCNDLGLRNELRIFLRTEGQDNYSQVSGERLDYSPSCGQGNYADNTLVRINHLEPGTYNVVACFSAEGGQDTFCTSDDSFKVK